MGARAGVAPQQWSDNDAVAVPVTFVGRSVLLQGAVVLGARLSVAHPAVRMVSTTIHDVDTHGERTAYG